MKFPDTFHLTEITDFPAVGEVPAIDLELTRVDNPDGSWTYFDKDGREVGCGFSVPRGVTF